jgi:hypothetical protein
MRRVAKIMLQGVCLGAVFFALGACPKIAKKQLYFEDLRPRCCLKVTVLKDVSMNPDTGGEITVYLVVEPNADKDELTGLLESIYRQVKVRRGFQKGDKPQKLDLRCYDAQAKAEKGGDDWLARASRDTSISEPTYENRQKPPLLKWATAVLKPSMPLFTKKEIKPQILADPIAMTLEVSYPFVIDDGSGAYVEKVSNEKFTTALSSTFISMFEKIPLLKKMTFVGKHMDKTVVKIWMTREQFTALDLKQVEELLGAFQGQFIEPMMSKQITSEQVHKKVIKQRRKVYREALGRLPKEQVELIKDLQ